MLKIWKRSLLILICLLATNFPNLVKADTVTSSDALVHFIDNKLIGKYGIYTNYLAKIGNDDTLATGHQYLSESSGYYLQYLAETKQNKKFRAFYALTKKTFYRQGVFLYRFDAKHPDKYQVNATVDDLRIISALVTYDKVNHTKKYQSEVKDLYKKLSIRVKQAGLLTDMYSLDSKTHNQLVTLCYQDLSVLKKLDSRSYHKALRVVEEGKISREVPLYYQSYNLKDKKYAKDKLVTPQLLITFLHLAEVDRLPKDSLNWVKQKVDTQTLYNAYSVTGKAEDKSTSAANYAIAMMIGNAVHDDQLYDAAKKVLLSMQVTDKKSEIYGSFGDSKTKQVYSFNELNALVALNQ
ncbi:glycoside hydrolase family 8 [Ligilactobacillus salivarius]|nr:glycoside hydrolase family 8 [Lactobacillus sp.]